MKRTDDRELTRQLSTTDGFTARYYNLLRFHKTYSEAYEATEQDHVRLFGRRRYSNYNSFRNVKDRKLKQN